MNSGILTLGGEIATKKFESFKTNLLLKHPLVLLHLNLTIVRICVSLESRCVHDWDLN